MTTLGVLSPAVAALVAVLAALSADAAALVASVEVSPAALALVADIAQRWSNDPRFSVSRKVSKEMLGIGPTRQIDLEHSGELRSYLDGTARRITLASIYLRLIKLAIRSRPPTGPVKARQPAARFKPQRRKPTEQELSALQRANERRREEARRRREVKSAARL
jgi:hypothetical protein